MKSCPFIYYARTEVQLHQKSNGQLEVQFDTRKRKQLNCVLDDIRSSRKGVCEDYSLVWCDTV
jgi:hypothetical protein